jgi:hypothetical protein
MLCGYVPDDDSFHRVVAASGAVTGAVVGAIAGGWRLSPTAKAVALGMAAGAAVVVPVALHFGDDTSGYAVRFRVALLTVPLGLMAGGLAGFLLRGGRPGPAEIIPGDDYEWPQSPGEEEPGPRMEAYTSGPPQRGRVFAGPLLPRPRASAERLVRRGWRGRLALAAVAAAPLVFLATLACLRTGRDLSAAFGLGLVLFFVGGVCLLLLGSATNRSDRTWGGAATCTAVVASLLLGMGRAVWIGGKTVPLTVAVRDAETGAPVAGASVGLFDLEGDRPRTVGRTDATGTASVSHLFTAYGSLSLVGDTGRVRFTWYSLRVEAEGYQTLTEPLDRYTGTHQDLHAPPPPRVVIALKKAGR